MYGLRKGDALGAGWRGENNLIGFIICWGQVRKEPGARKPSRNPQGWLQLRILARVERVPELAMHCNQTDDYLNCHQRAFI